MERFAALRDNTLQTAWAWGHKEHAMMMRYEQDVRWLMLVFGITVASFASFQRSTGATEHALVIEPRLFERMDPTPVPEVLSMSSQIGPRIDMRRPGEQTVFQAGEPVAVDIAFLPANDGSEPDMETLEVTVRKGIFGMDITETVKPYVQGTAIRVPEVDFSGYRGNFQFMISIKDRQRRGSQLWFSVTIRF